MKRLLVIEPVRESFYRLQPDVSTASGAIQLEGNDRIEFDLNLFAEVPKPAYSYRLMRTGYTPVAAVGLAVFWKTCSTYPHPYATTKQRSNRFNLSFSHKVFAKNRASNAGNAITVC